MTDRLAEWRLTLRGLARNPLFTLVTVATLALGIGSTTAVYSFVDGIVLSPLGYRSPDRLAVGHLHIPQFAEQAPVVPTSLRVLDAWRGGCRSTCLDVAGLSQPFQSVTDPGEGPAETLRGVRVTPGFFDLLGAEPLLGRVFRSGEGGPGRARVAVLTHGLWQRRYGGDPAVLGRTFSIGGDQVEVVGVLPEGFRSFRLSDLYPIDTGFGVPEFYEPLFYTAEEAAQDVPFGWVALIRLADAVTQSQVVAELDALVSAAYAESTIQPTTVLRTLQGQVIGEASQPLWLMLGAVVTMLLVASLNVANLLGTRWLERRRDLAVRQALGATRGDAVRRAARESLALALVGGLAGLAVADLLLRALLTTVPASVPRLDEVGLDGRVLAGALLVTLATGAFCALTPAWQSSRTDPIEALKRDGRSGRRQGRIPGLLVGVQTVAGITLVAAAGLLLTSFWQVLGVERGFDVDRALAADVRLPSTRYSEDQERLSFYDQLLERLADSPGVVATGWSQRLPLEGVAYVQILSRDDDTRPELQRPLANLFLASPDYPRALGLSLAEGRFYTDADRERNVIVVSETTARRFWPGESPLGRRVSLGQEGEIHEVVGVMRDGHLLDLEGEDGLVAYLPHWDQPLGLGTVVVRADVPAAAMTETLRAAVAAVDPAVEDRRFQLSLTGAFALVGLLLVGLGVYGVVASTVAQRRGEPAVRLALGATLGRLFSGVLGQGLRPVLIGLVAGLASAVVTGRALAALLFDVAPADPVVLSGAVAVMLVVAVLACLVPAFRAVRTSPLLVLKAE